MSDLRVEAHRGVSLELTKSWHGSVGQPGPGRVGINDPSDPGVVVVAREYTFVGSTGLRLSRANEGD